MARREGRILGRRRAHSLWGLFILIISMAFLILMRTFIVDLAIASGSSMLPGIRPKDIVLVFKAAYGLRIPGRGYILAWSRPRNRDVVAALRPDGGTILVKRIAYERADSALGDPVFLLGDNLHESQDSREFGPVPMNNVLGKVVSFR